jgi:hypothetical protein
MGFYGAEAIILPFFPKGPNLSDKKEYKICCAWA